VTARRNERKGSWKNSNMEEAIGVQEGTELDEYGFLQLLEKAEREQVVPT